MGRLHLKRLTLLTTLFAALALLTCGDDSGSNPDLGDNEPVENPPTTTEISQAFLFEISHTNTAWGSFCRGLYVDSAGYVYTYDLGGQIWNPGNNGFYTESQLTEKYNHNRVLVDSVSLETLDDMYQLISPAAAGELSERVHPCVDAGGQLYSAYVVDNRSSKYYPVMVYEAGDYAQKNLSDAAAQLFEWMQTLNDGAYANPACAYPE